MKPELLKIMKCPYCAGDLRLGDIHERNDTGVVTGFLACECSKFPVVEGILHLKFDALRDYLVKLIEEQKPLDAAGLAVLSEADTGCKVARSMDHFGAYGHVLARTLRTVLMIMAKRAYKRYSNDRPSFCDLLHDGDFETYLKHRFSAESFWSLYPFLGLLKENSQTILDLACGTGHAAFVVSASVNPDWHVCADYTFSNLYLAKKYFAPNAQYICLDANYPLPFKDDVFSTITMLDAFHYVKARASLASEMERILATRGLLLILHMHTALQVKALRPSAWIGLFRELHVRAFPEREVVEDFLLRNKLDLSKKWSEMELSDRNALIVVGASNSAIFRNYERVAKVFLSCRSNLVINPIYEIEHGPDGLALRRRFPSEKFRKEFSLSERYLPRQWLIERRFAHIIKGRTLDLALASATEATMQYVDDLMRKFIVVNVPRQYC